MKKNSILILILLLISSCNEPQQAPQSYDNPDIGFHMTYPADWEIKKNEWLKNLIKSNVNEEFISKEDQELVSSIILSLVKEHTVDGKIYSSSLNLLVLDAPKEEWKEWDNMDMSAYLDILIENNKHQFPGMNIVKNKFALRTNESIRNYMSTIQIQDRTVTQYFYIYWHKPYLVQMGFSYGHPDLKNEIKNIIDSVKIVTKGK